MNYMNNLNPTLYWDIILSNEREKGIKAVGDIKKTFFDKCKEVKQQSRQLNKQLEDAKFDAEDLQTKYDEEHKLCDLLKKEKAKLQKTADTLKADNKKKNKAISELHKKHAEEVVALNKRAEQMNAKNKEDWDELQEKYIESRLKVGRMKPDYDSYQA